MLRVTQPGRNVLVTAVNEVVCSKRYTAGVIFLLVVALVSCFLKQIFEDLRKDGDVYRGKKLKNLQLDEDEYEMLKMLQVKF